MSDSPKFAGQVRWIVRWAINLDGTRERVVRLQQAVDIAPAGSRYVLLSWQDVPEVDET